MNGIERARVWYEVYGREMLAREFSHAVPEIAVGIAVGYTADGVLRAFGYRQVCVEMPSADDKKPTSVKDMFIKQDQDDREI